MADSTWFVAVEGNQLGGGHSDEQVKELARTNAGRQILVWREPMVEWVDPKTIPALSGPPSASETAAGAVPVPAPRPAPAPAPAKSPSPSPYSSPVRPSAAAALEDAKGALKEESKFFAGLLDLKFQRLITPKVIGTLYAVALVLIALGVLAMVFSGLAGMVAGARFGGFAGVLTGVALIVVAPILGIFQAAVLRVFFELALVLFRIKENTEALRTK